jgi:hypothetical protein
MSTEPTPVEVTNTEPLPVKVIGANLIADTRAPSRDGKPREMVQRQSDDPSLPATTTFQEDLTQAGQRHINAMWETTQMRIALSVVWASLLVAVVLSVAGKGLGSTELQLAAVVFIFGVANLVTGFYFGRTNHTKTGGVGPNERGR